MFGKNFVTNYRLIGNYQEQMESLLKGNDMFGSGGNQYEIIVMWNHVPETDRGDELSIQGTQVWFTL